MYNDCYEIWKEHNEWFMDSSIDTLREILTHYDEEASYRDKCVTYVMLQKFLSMMVNHDVLDNILK